MATADLMQHAEAVCQLLRLSNEHVAVKRGLDELRAQVGSESCQAFLSEVLAVSPGFVDLLAAWRNTALQQNTAAAIALTHTFTTLLATSASTNLSAALRAAIFQLGRELLQPHNMKGFYFHLSADDHTKTNHALAALTAAISLSCEHVALFLAHFDFSLASLPKLAAPARSGNVGKSAVRQRSSWSASRLAKRPTRACYVQLAVACLRAAHGATAVAAAVQAPRLWSLVLKSLATDPAHAVVEVCEVLLQRVLLAGSAGPGRSAITSCLQPEALLQLAKCSAADGSDDADEEQLRAAHAAHEVLLAAVTSCDGDLWSAERHTVVEMEGLADVDDWGLCPWQARQPLGVVRERTLSRPSKGLLGLISSLRCTVSANHLRLLLRVVEASPLAASVALMQLELSADPLHARTSKVRTGVAVHSMRHATGQASALEHALHRPPSASNSSEDAEAAASAWLAQRVPRRLSKAVHLLHGTVTTFIPTPNSPCDVQGMLTKALQSDDSGVRAAAIDSVHAVAAALYRISTLCSSQAARAPDARAFCRTASATLRRYAEKHLPESTALEAAVQDAWQAADPQRVAAHAADSQEEIVCASSAQATADTSGTGEDGPQVHVEGLHDVSMSDESESGSPSSELADSAGSDRGEPSSGGASSGAETSADGDAQVSRATAERPEAALLLEVLTMYSTVTVPAPRAAKARWALVPGLAKGSTTAVDAVARLPSTEQVALAECLCAALCVEDGLVGPAALGAAWSAAFLKPFLALLAAAHDARVREACRALVHGVLTRLGLHTGPDELMLPFSLALPGTSKQPDSVADMLCDVLTSTLTACVRRPQEMLAQSSFAVSVADALQRRSDSQQCQNADRADVPADEIAPSFAGISALFALCQAAANVFRGRAWRTEGGAAAVNALWVYLTQLFDMMPLIQAADAAQRATQRADVATAALQVIVRTVVEHGDVLTVQRGSEVANHASAKRQRNGHRKGAPSQLGADGAVCLLVAADLGAFATCLNSLLRAAALEGISASSGIEPQLAAVTLQLSGGRVSIAQINVALASKESQLGSQSHAAQAADAWHAASGLLRSVQPAAAALQVETTSASTTTTYVWQLLQCHARIGDLLAAAGACGGADVGGRRLLRDFEVALAKLPEPHARFLLLVAKRTLTDQQQQRELGAAPPSDAALRAVAVLTAMSVVAQTGDTEGASASGTKSSWPAASFHPNVDSLGDVTRLLSAMWELHRSVRALTCLQPTMGVGGGRQGGAAGAERAAALEHVVLAGRLSTLLARLPANVSGQLAANGLSNNASSPATPQKTTRGSAHALQCARDALLCAALSDRAGDSVHGAAQDAVCTCAHAVCSEALAALPRSAVLGALECAAGTSAASLEPACVLAHHLLVQPWTGGEPCLASNSACTTAHVEGASVAAVLRRVLKRFAGPDGIGDAAAPGHFAAAALVQAALRPCSHSAGVLAHAQTLLAPQLLEWRLQQALRGRAHASAGPAIDAPSGSAEPQRGTTAAVLASSSRGDVLRALSALSSEVASTAAVQTLGSAVRQLASSLLRVALAHKDDPQVWSHALQLADAVRSAALKDALRPSCSEPSVKGHQDLQAVQLVELCLRFRPMQGSKMAALLLKCAPAEALAAASSQQALVLSRFDLAVRMVCSAAEACGVVVASAWGAGGHVLVADGTADQVAGWTATLLRCASRTVAACSASTGNRELPQRGGQACGGGAVRAAIDGPIGDVVAGLVAIGLGEQTLTELAAASQALVRAVLPSADVADLRLVRRLWAALVPEDAVAGFYGVRGASAPRSSDAGSSDEKNDLVSNDDRPQSSSSSRSSGSDTAALATPVSPPGSVTEDSEVAASAGFCTASLQAQQSGRERAAARSSMRDNQNGERVGNFVTIPAHRPCEAVGTAAEEALRAVLLSHTVRRLISDGCSSDSSTTYAQHVAPADLAVPRLSPVRGDAAAAAAPLSKVMQRARDGGPACVTDFAQPVPRPPVPAEVAQQPWPLGSLVQSAAPSVMVVQPAAAADARCEALTLLETLVACVVAHTEASPSCAARAAVAEHAQAVLPQLLLSYGGTMAPGDRACLQLMRSLDVVTMAGGAASLLQQAGGLWGTLLAAALDGSTPVESLLLQPELLEPRRMALAVTCFPEARTLLLSEADPFQQGASSAWFATTAHALAAYDPAFMVPCALQLLRGGQLTARTAVATGWLPLLLRCLGSREDDLRAAAYDCVALVAISADAAAADANAAGRFREARQVTVLLATLRASLSAPRPCLPPSVAVFLAEAATAIANPTSFLYPIVNKFLLRGATLPIRGLPLFQAMYSALGADWRRCRAWADALALAAPALHSARRTLLAEAVAATTSACGGQGADLAAVQAYIECAVRASGAPSVAAHLVTSGELACLASQLEWLLRAPFAQAAEPAALVDSGNSQKDAGARPLAVAQLALTALLQSSRAAHVWRASTADAAALAMGAAVAACAPHLRALGDRQDAMALHDVFWELLHSVLRGARAWCPRRAAALGLHATFWRRLCLAVPERGHAGAGAALAECLMSVHVRALLVTPCRASSCHAGATLVLPEALRTVCAYSALSEAASSSDAHMVGAWRGERGVRVCAWLLACFLQCQAHSMCQSGTVSEAAGRSVVLEHCSMPLDAQSHAANALVTVWASCGSFASQELLLLFLACGFENTVDALTGIAAGAQSVAEGLAAAVCDHTGAQDAPCLRDVLLARMRQYLVSVEGLDDVTGTCDCVALHTVCEAAASWLPAALQTAV